MLNRGKLILSTCQCMLYIMYIAVFHFPVAHAWQLIWERCGLLKDTIILWVTCPREVRKCQQTLRNCKSHLSVLCASDFDGTVEFSLWMPLRLNPDFFPFLLAPRKDCGLMGLFLHMQLEAVKHSFRHSLKQKVQNVSDTLKHRLRDRIIHSGRGKKRYVLHK